MAQLVLSDGTTFEGEPFQPTPAIAGLRPTGGAFFPFFKL